MFATYGRNPEQLRRPLRINVRSRAQVKPNQNLNDDEENHVISIIGVNKIMNRKNHWCVRLVWFAALATAFGLCGVQLYRCINLYLSNPVIKQTDIIRSEVIDFPAIHACPGYVRELQAIYTDGSREVCRDNKLSCWVTDPYQVEFLDSFPEFQPNVTLYELQHGAKTPMELFKMCEEDDSCEADGALWNGDVIPTYTIAGECQSFDTAEVVQFRGPFTYTVMHIAVPVHQIIIGKLSDKLKKTNLEKDQAEIRESMDRIRIGAIISVYHSTTANKKHLFFYDSQDVFVGYETHLQIHQKEFTLLNRTQYPCDTEDRVMQCINDCIERNLSSICNPPYYSGKAEKDCTFSMDYVRTEIHNFEVYNQLNLTKCNCPKQCNEVTYTMFPNVITELSEKSNITIKIYFADSNVEKTTEKFFYDFNACLSDFGGNLGFFLGFCTLIIVEIIEFSVLKLVGQRKTKVGKSNKIAVIKYKNNK